MQIYTNQKQLLMEQRRKLEAQAAELAKVQANQDYIAMMTDIDLDADESEDTDNEQ